MLKYTEVKLVQMQDFDKLVVETYGRPYKLQQQDGCMDRETIEFPVPILWPIDYKTDPRNEYGVSFADWLAAQPPTQSNADVYKRLRWHRHFYPSLDMLVNDLHAKGLMPAGSYCIIIDW